MPVWAASGSAAVTLPAWQNSQKSPKACWTCQSPSVFTGSCPCTSWQFLHDEADVPHCACAEAAGDSRMKPMIPTVARGTINRVLRMRICPPYEMRDKEREG